MKGISAQIKQITQMGVSIEMPLTVKRSVELSNQIGMIAFPLLMIYILVNSLIRYNAINIAAAVGLMTIFGLVLLLNRFAQTILSRSLIAFSFPMIILIAAIQTKLSYQDTTLITPYYGDRVYLIMGSIFPVLLFDLRTEKVHFLSGLAFVLTCLLIYQPLHSWWGLGIERLDSPHLEHRLVTDISYVMTMVGLILSLSFLKGINNHFEHKLVLLQSDLKQAEDEKRTQYEELSQQQEELEAQRDAIAEKNNEIFAQKRKLEGSLAAALPIQKTIIPSYTEMEDAIGIHFALFLPKDVVSGDFYWVGEANGHVVLFLGDCTGHGVPGAFITLICKNILDESILQSGMHSPAMILESLDQKLYQYLHQQSSHNNDGLEGAVVVWKRGSDSLIYAGAKTPLWHVAPKCQLTTIPATRRSVGGLGKRIKPFEEHTIHFGKDDRFYLATDGFADQADTSGKRFTKARLTDLIHQLSSKPFDEQSRTLEAHFHQYKKGVHQRDDVTIVGFMPSAAYPLLA